MRTRTLLGVLLILLAVGPAQAKDAEAPRADQVVARGSRDLAHALEVAAHAAWTGADRPVAIVVDVTENTRKQRGALAEALVKLAPRAVGATSWRIGPLGKRVGDAVPAPSDLVSRLEGVFRADTPSVSTVKALRASVRSAPKKAVVVYLADWRFEDDTGLDELVSDLERGDRLLSVVGSEAAFGRAWNDGIRDGFDRIDRDSFEKQPYEEGIGRSPFGPSDHAAPWHGGDSAYPAVPYRFAHRWWRTEFSPGELESGAGAAFDPENIDDIFERMKNGDDLEDLKKRLPGFVGKSEGGGGTFRQIPLPSAFGPYGLMRAAGLTGGRYVLWSWNPSGRTSVKYDFARCNTYAPDLRARSAIRADAGRDGLARAMVKAWHALLDVDGELIEITSPLKKSAAPQEIEVVEPSGSFAFSWRDHQAWKDFIRVAGYAAESLDDAAKVLDRALAKANPSLPARYVADAALFRHIVRVLRFQVGEALAVANQVPKDAWKDDETQPGIVPSPWILPGNDPEAIKTTDVEIQDPEAGQGVMDARREMLRRYGQTPFGELVGLNGVSTFEPTRMKKLDPSDFAGESGRSPSESTGEKPTTPPKRPGGPGTGSGGGGPSTGR